MGLFYKNVAFLIAEWQKNGKEWKIILTSIVQYAVCIEFKTMLHCVQQRGKATSRRFPWLPGPTKPPGDFDAVCKSAGENPFGSFAVRDGWWCRGKANIDMYLYMFETRSPVWSSWAIIGQVWQRTVARGRSDAHLLGGDCTICLILC